MLKKPFFVIVAACLVFLQSACSTNENGTAQPPANQSGQSTGQEQKPSDQVSKELDLTRELTLNPSLVVGKTTYAELVQKYGKPIKEGTYKTAFRKGLHNAGAEHPQISGYVGFFKLNPLTGEKTEKGFPLYFTHDDKKVLVASHIALSRGDLLEKIKQDKATLADVKALYGEPTRENEKGLEYYDFHRNIVMFVVRTDEGKINTLVTKYDLLFAGDAKDLEAHEQAIQELSAKQKANK